MQCPGEEAFIDAFNTEAASLNISDHDGHLCMIEDDHSNHTRGIVYANTIMCTNDS